MPPTLTTIQEKLHFLDQNKAAQQAIIDQAQAAK